MLPPVRPIEEQFPHLLHLVVTLVTFGLWFPLWIIAMLNTDRKNKKALRKYQLELYRYECWRQYEQEQQIAYYNTHRNHNSHTQTHER